MKKPKVLLTGSSGFIGKEVAYLLSVTDYPTRLMVRNPHEASALFGQKMEIAPGDLTDPKTLKTAVKNIDCVIHLAARATFEDYETLKPTILDGSMALIRAAVECGVKSFAYGSSLLVYGDQVNEVDEKTVPTPVLDYGKIKLDTEKRLKEISGSAGIAFCALRLPHVYGAEDLYFKNIRRGLLILPGLGKNIFSHLHVADTARLIIACAVQSYSGITPVSDRLPATWEEFLSVVRQHYPDCRSLVLPAWVALFSAFLLTPFRRLRPYPGLETPGAVRSYNCRMRVKPDLVWKDLSLEPQFPTIHEGIPSVIADLKKQGR